MISFLHSADLHLGGPFGAYPPAFKELLVDYQFKCLRKLVATALERKVDAILFAGDLFDSPRPSEEILERVRKTLAPLEDQGIYFILALGNHDAGFDKKRLSQGPVIVLDDRNPEIINFKNWRLVGMSFSEQWDMRKPSDYLPRKEEIFTVGLFHSGLEDKLYMPLSLEESRYLDYDYFALGHKHSFSEYFSRAFYSGNLAQYGGGPGGFLYFEVGDEKPQWIASEDFPIEEVTIKINDPLLDTEDLARYRNRSVKLILEGSLEAEDSRYLDNWLKDNEDIFCENRTLLSQTARLSPLYVKGRYILVNSPEKILSYLDPLEESKEELLRYIEDRKDQLLEELEELFRGSYD